MDSIIKKLKEAQGEIEAQRDSFMAESPRVMLKVTRCNRAKAAVTQAISELENLTVYLGQEAKPQ